MNDDPVFHALQMSYRAIANTPAFQELLTCLDANAAEAERNMLAYPVNTPTFVYRTAFVTWQQRKEIAALVREQVAKAEQFLRGLEEEAQIERDSRAAVDASRAGRGNW